MNLRFTLTALCLLIFSLSCLPVWPMEYKNGIRHIDTLPDGRFIWEMTDYEKSIFYGDPMETEMSRRWRLKQAKEMGLADLSLTTSERLYLLGQKFSVALPSSKLMSGATVADDIARTGEKAAQRLIRLKNTRPQFGEYLAFTIQDSKILFNGRAVSHGRHDFIITKSGHLSVGKGHYYLSGKAEEVLAAGEIRIYDGQIKAINNWSGHYRPSIEISRHFPDLFRNLGLNVSRAKLQLYNQEGVLVETIRLP